MNPKALTETLALRFRQIRQYLKNNNKPDALIRAGRTLITTAHSLDIVGTNDICSVICAIHQDNHPIRLLNEIIEQYESDPRDDSRAKRASTDPRDDSRAKRASTDPRDDSRAKRASTDPQDIEPMLTKPVRPNRTYLKSVRPNRTYLKPVRPNRTYLKRLVGIAYSKFPDKYRVTAVTCGEKRLIVGDIVAMDRDYFTVYCEPGEEANVTYDDLREIVPVKHTT